MTQDSDEQAGRPTASQWTTALVPYQQRCPGCGYRVWTRQDDDGTTIPAGCEHVEILEQLIVAAVKRGSLA